MTDAYDEATLNAIGDLLSLGEQHGFGITFEPDAEGWTVGYLRGQGGGDLITGFDLGDTARGALRPLLELAGQFDANRRGHEGE
jgi:hypothetical protein